MGFFDWIFAVPCLRHITNQMRDEVNRLRGENAELKAQNDHLEESQKKLREVEAKLEEISILQGQNIDALLAQVREFREIQGQVKESLQAKVIQNLIGVILTSDSDKDFVIDPEEVDGLVLRLKSIDGVDFSEANFAKALKKSGYDPEEVKAEEGGYSINAVIEVMRNLLDDDVPTEDNIFTIKADAALVNSIQIVETRL